MRRVSQRTVGMLNLAVDIRSRLEDVPYATVSGAEKWVNEIMKGAETLSKQRVGVKTGRTKASIKIKYKAREGHPTAVIDYWSWIPAWIASGGNRRYDTAIRAIMEQRGMTRKQARKEYARLTHNRMKKVHPTYWSYRPMKQLASAVKSQRLMERYINASLRSVRVE